MSPTASRGHRQGPVRQGNRARRGESHPCREVEAILLPVAQAAGDRRQPQALRHHDGRRQRLGQDHDHRQAGRKVPGRGQIGDAGGRRHLPRRRHRAAQGLGRTHRRPVVAREQGADSSGLAYRCADRGARQRLGCADDRHRRPAAEQDRADGRAGKDHPRHPEGRRQRAPCVLLVLDATVGQNALSQVEIFGKRRRRHRAW
jgi:hypothetical protein